MANGNNINKATRKNQYLLAGLIGIAIAASIGGIWVMNNYANQQEEQPQYEDEQDDVLEPELKGAVTSSFDGQVGSQVMTDAQAESKQNREAMNEILEELATIRQQLEDSKKQNDELVKRLDESDKLQGDIIGQIGEIRHNGKLSSVDYPNDVEEPTPTVNRGTMKKSSSKGKEKSTANQQKGVVKLSNPPEVKGVFERKTYTKKAQALNSGSFYVPSGSFSNAIILEGADVSASVTAKTTNALPMQFKLLGDLHLPMNKKLSKLNGCFVTAGAYGEISSERAIVRLQRLSCVINGKHIDQPVTGHVAFYGKNGIKGTPVMRNGKMLGLAFMSGALGGIGSATSQIGNSQVGLGASRVIGADEVLRQTAGGGVSAAANKLADYYIQRAEQYHPVIPIGSANRVEVVFNKGFWAKFVEDSEGEEKAQPSEPNQNEMEQDSSQEQIPDELQGELGRIEDQTLSDFVTPNQK